MVHSLPTQRLSPKHQVTLPRGARALTGADVEGYVCGTLHRMRKPETGESFRVVVLMTERELQRREEAIRQNQELDPARAEALIADLNGNVQRMAIDAQRRVVLPGHFVRYLRLERELYMFSTNTTVLVWNPQDWLRWSGGDDEDEEGEAEPGPAPFLMV